MASAYTPGLSVIESTVIRKIRELPIPGKNLVAVGAVVDSQTPVLSADLPGDIDIVRVSQRMGFDPEDVISHMKVAPGDSVKKGDLLCELKTFFGLFTTQCLSPSTGVVEFFTQANAHLGIRQASKPLTVKAYIEGTVVEVDEGKSVTIETQGSFLQGIFGVGGERQGQILYLEVPDQTQVGVRELEKHKQALLESIIIGGACFTIEALRYACEHGVSGIITGSIDAETLKAYVGKDISVSITGDEDVKATLIITEGFGKLPLSARFSALAKKLHGTRAAINGATQVRAGAMRPELIVSNSTMAPHAHGTEASAPLEIGAHIRIIRVPYFGEFGEVVSLPSQPEAIPTGASVRVLKAKLRNGDIVTVPRANVELA